MGPKWVPNRIFDAEALRKPLGALLERSCTLLEPKKTCLSKGPESAFMEEPFAWPPGLRDWSGNDSTYVFVSRALYVFGYLFEAEKYTNNNSPTGPKIVQIIPRWLQNPPQLAPKLVLEPSWRPLGYGSFSRSLIFASSWPLGTLLETSGAPNTLLGSALGRPKGTLETGFSVLGSQMASRKEPRRLPNRGPKVI